MPRQEAVRRMFEFGDKYHLSLGEPVTRKLLREGHRFDGEIRSGCFCRNLMVLSRRPHGGHAL
jgi:hypothetical protein